MIFTFFYLGSTKFQGGQAHSHTLSFQAESFFLFPKLCFIGENLTLLFEFSREYQMEGLKQSCVQFLIEDIAKTPDGDCHLCDLLVVASEYSATDHLEQLIAKVARLETAVILKIHGKVDNGVLAAVYMAKSKKSEAIVKSLPRPGAKLPHILLPGYLDRCVCSVVGCNRWGWTNGIRPCVNCQKSSVRLTKQ